MHIQVCKLLHALDSQHILFSSDALYAHILLVMREKLPVNLKLAEWSYVSLHATIAIFNPELSQASKVHFRDFTGSYGLRRAQGCLRDCIVAQLSSRCLQLCLVFFMVIGYVVTGQL